MLKVRFQRIGCRKYPFFRLVLMNSVSPREGKGIVSLGYYNPKSKTLVFNEEKLKVVLNNGAIITEGVVKKFKSSKLIKIFK